MEFLSNNLIAICVFWFVIGCITGSYCYLLYSKKQVRTIFKLFQDEMHKQYLILLEKHGIKLNDSGKKVLNKK